jgi:N-acetylglucosamine-6-sulfatase
VANIDIAPTVMAAMGLKPPAHFDGANALPLLRGEPVDWRKEFLYVYYWEKNFPHSPTVFALREQRYKYITYYGLWDVDELYDLEADPHEAHNLRYYPAHAARVKDMEARLYAMMDRLGGMELPLNAPRGSIQGLRLRSRDGEEAADFPSPLVTDKPERRSAR